MSKQTVPESQLVTQLIAGSRAAWADFVGRYETIVCARIRRTGLELHRSLSASDVDDMCAEVFASLVANDFSALRRFEGRCQLSTWLGIIARRTCLKQLLRNREPNASGGSDVWDPLDQESFLRDSLQRLVQHEDRCRLREQMQQLKPRDQEILRLFYMENLSYAQVGQQLNISINTVGPCLHRAQQRLKKLLLQSSQESNTNASEARSRLS